MQNKTIDYIAEAMPQTLEELATIKGIGPKKLKELGPAILVITTGEETNVKEKVIRVSESGERIFSVRPLEKEGLGVYVFQFKVIRGTAER